MSNKFHTAYQDGVDGVSSSGLDDGQTAGLFGLGALDRAIGKLANHAFATTQVPMTQNGDVVEFGEIEIFFHQDTSGGNIIKNTIPTGTITLTNTSTKGEFAVATLSETDGGTASLAVMDYDGLTSTSTLGSNSLVLFGRPPLATVRSNLHYVGLKPHVPLRGVATLTNAATTLVVTHGYTLPSVRYHVLCGMVTGGQRSPWVADASISTTAFTITHASATTGDQVFWMIVT